MPDGTPDNPTPIRASPGVGHNGGGLRSSGDEPRNPPPAAATAGAHPRQATAAGAEPRAVAPCSGTWRTLRRASRAGAGGI